MKLAQATTQYFAGVVAEFKRVSFPSRRDIVIHTAVVVVAILLMIGFLAVVDGFFAIGVKLLFSNA